MSFATAGAFEQQEVDQNKFVALAVPRVGSTPQLVILEQISDSQPCWKESGTSPVTVERLYEKWIGVKNQANRLTISRIIEM